MKYILQLANKRIAVESLFPDCKSLCQEYISEDAADFSIATTQRDIDFERERAKKVARKEGRPEPNHSDGYLETLAVYRKIAERMPFFDRMLMHGSCVAVDGAAYLFIARSGTGKSTHTRLWRKLLGDRAVMVNDDKPLVQVAAGKAIIYGTPWDGKHRLSSNVAVPLQAVCILERAEENSIRPLIREEALPMLLQQSYRPFDPAALAKTVALVERLAGAVKLYRLGCNMDIKAAELSYTTMKEG